jgi:uncharacterized protein YaeQ
VKASGRSDLVSVYAFGHSAPGWWTALSGRIGRTRNIEAWLVPFEQSRALAALAERGMRLQVSRQDGAVLVADGAASVELHLQRLA